MVRALKQGLLGALSIRSLQQITHVQSVTSCRMREPMTTPSFKAGDLLFMFQAANLGGSQQVAFMISVNDERKRG